MNGLAQNKWQAIIRTNMDLLSAELFVIKLSDNKNHSSQENTFKRSSAKQRPFYLSLKVLTKIHYANCTIA